jgi:shikimate dehydrogenase
VSPKIGGLRGLPGLEQMLQATQIEARGTCTMTKFVGLIGHKLSHSISQQFQQAAFDHLGLDIRYQVWDTARDELPDIVEGLRDDSRLGANVTIPYKEAVLSLLNKVDKDARRIGAVNTIVKRDDKLVGYNTDAGGFIRALEEEGGFDPRGKRVVLIGAGGAARAVSFALIDAGVRSLVILNRSIERGRELAKDLKWDLKDSDIEVIALSWKDGRTLTALSGCDLLVNCTSVGMKDSASEGKSPLSMGLIPKRALVYDVVYNPLETPLIVAAKKAGAHTLGGLPMLVYQGAESVELWTGKAAPIDIMMKVAKRALTK